MVSVRQYRSLQSCFLHCLDRSKPACSLLVRIDACTQGDCTLWIINLISRLESSCAMLGTHMEYVELMRRSVKRLDQYITKLAHYTRNNNVDIEYSEINFQSVINEIIETYQFLPNAERIEFKVSIDTNQTVCSDLFRLQLILNNVISNSIKYCNTQEPNPRIEVSIKATTAKFRIKVKDNGIGIAEEHQDKIFNMFHRATTQAHGSGIGLYIVKKALQKMNGKIKVKSSYGMGTELKLTIPNHFQDCISHSE
jgi:two-component system, sensor histidine kinase and response regulator